MSGFFFGPPDRELYGFYHPPVGDGRAVILCPSLGLEYQYAHRALRVLAQRLAENGSHVLRFDYRGTGNSWGKDTEVDLDQWCDDLDLAARELRTMSGKPRLDFVGLRLGGAVAQKVGEEFGGVDRLVLWDPVLNGADWIRGQLSVAGKHFQSSAEGTTDEGLEVGCHLASPSLLEQIDAIRTHGLDGGCFGEVFFLSTREECGEEYYRGFLRAATNTEFRHLPQPAPWEEDTSIWGGHLPVEAVKSILDWLDRP